MKQYANMLTAAAFSGVILCSSVQAGEREMLLGTMAVPGTTVETASKLFAEKVNGVLAGEVTFRVNDSLLKGAQLAPSVRDGVIEAVVAVHPYLSGSEPMMGLQNLSGVIRTSEDYEKALAGFWRDELAKIWSENWNSVVVAEGAWSEHNLFVSKPVKKAEDFKGLKIRVHNKETALFISQLGASPTPLDASEMAAGLERGVIDGLFTPSCYAYKQELFRTAKYIENWHIGPIQGWAILINNDTWASLTVEQQAAIKAAGAAVEIEMWANFHDATAACIDGMTADGATYSEASPEEVAKIFDKANVDPVLADWSGRMAEKNYDAEDTLAKANASISGK